MSNLEYMRAVARIDRKFKEVVFIANDGQNMVEVVRWGITFKIDMYQELKTFFAECSSEKIIRIDEALMKEW